MKNTQGDDESTLRINYKRRICAFSKKYKKEPQDILDQALREGLQIIRKQQVDSRSFLLKYAHLFIALASLSGILLGVLYVTLIK
ncbi:MAG: hypothetical protein D3916_14730 [Candidatus Electrothrix sp. MAN1_4]|nr:hypothetical protein [Candidatus Electrothrix sp. MAN1_4]